MSPTLFLMSHYKGTNIKAPLAAGITLEVRVSWDHDWHHK